MKLFFSVKVLFGKELVTISKTSTAFLVSKWDSQNKNSLDGVSMHIANEDKELATLRDVCSFNQLHTEGEW
jgi:hypothetical protein